MILPDFKDRQGNWVPFACQGKHKVVHKTVSYSYWLGMLARCKVDGCVQRDMPSYEGVRCKFEDYGAFTDWAVKQVGYGLKSYELDKDILSGNNKVYSPETCVFIPKILNNFVRTLKKYNRGNLPQGVYKSSKSYLAYCVDEDGLRVYLGRYQNPHDAGQAYKTFKENVSRKLAERWKDHVDQRVYNFLVSVRL